MNNQLHSKMGHSSSQQQDKVDHLAIQPDGEEDHLVNRQSNTADHLNIQPGGEVDHLVNQQGKEWDKMMLSHDHGYTLVIS